MFFAFSGPAFEFFLVGHAVLAGIEVRIGRGVEESQIKERIASNYCAQLGTSTAAHQYNSGVRVSLCSWTDFL